MKKRILSFLLSACMLITMLPTTVFADEAATNVLPDALDLTEGNITIKNGTDEGTLKVTYGAAMVVDNIEPSAIINITQTDVATVTTYKIEIAADVTGGVNIKLSGVNIKPSKGAALAINAGAGKVNLILADNSGNKLTGAEYYAGLQKNNAAREADGLLTISCESASLSGHICNDNCGKLTANTGDFGAGIGGGQNGTGSHISIYGGDITATGGENGAGIGGGENGAGSHISIYGGDITATGGDLGAGIGGGGSGTGSHISIYGGNITATGGSFGAGIGSGGIVAPGIGGVGPATGSHISIYGGDITATGGSYAAGIGGGSYGEGSNINIYDGNINATGAWVSSGIGGGNNGNGSNINIEGGNIYATGGTGIGGGSAGEGNNINISGGIVTAVGQYAGAGIGGGNGKDGSNITISGGIVSATGGNSGGAGIGGGGGSSSGPGGKGRDITISGGTVTAKSTTTAYDIGGGGISSSGASLNIKITGGNIYASTIGGTPQNGSGIDVYKATFSIPDDTTGETNLAALSFTSNDTPYSYTMNDTISILDEGAGKLFVYLPVGTYSTEYSGKTYTAKVDVSGQAEFVDLQPTVTAFSFNGFTPNVTGTINEASKTISLTVPFGTDVTTLVPTITHTGASISPNTGVAQNFTSPVEYTVTAADSTTQKYIVTVTVAANPAKAITAFNFNGLTPNVTGTVNEASKTIALTVPYGTNVTALVPSITHSGASVSPNTGVPQNFTSPVEYTVTAADSSTQKYIVTVTVAANPAKAITAFNFNGLTPNVTGTVNEASKTIALTVPYGTNVTALVPSITHSGASVSPNTGVPQNFTSPVEYTVTAADSSTQKYIVTVTVASKPGGGSSGGSTPTPPAPVITVSEVTSELFSNAGDIKVEADVNSAFGQSVEVKITDSTESQNEIFKLAGTDGEVYPFDISLYSKGSNEKIQPKDGYSVKITLPVPEKLLNDKDKIKVVYSKDGKLETLKSELIEKDGKWYIVFETSHFSPYALVVSAEPWTNPFNDIKEGDWYYSAIQYVSQNGLMLGTGGNTFSPQLTTNRGMIATILYRLNGSDETFESTFKDVIPGAYYTNAVAWAQEKGIIAGYGNGMFGPEDSITREQMATILWRYAGSPAADITILSDFIDMGEISDYAKNALAWANQMGIINGKGNGILDPKGKATRAEVAQIMYNFVQKAGIIK